MSVKRAAIRRERAQRAKAERNKAPGGRMERARNRGMVDGRNIAASVVLEILHEKYNFSKSKVNMLLECVSKEAAKMDNDGARFVMEYYAQKITEKINSVDIFQKIDDIETQVYCVARDDFFVTSVAVLITALNELFGFSSFRTGRGRLDYIMEYCVNRYIEMSLDPENKTADYYFQRMKRKTGYDIE